MFSKVAVFVVALVAMLSGASAFAPARMARSSVVNSASALTHS